MAFSSSPVYPTIISESPPLYYDYIFNHAYCPDSTTAVWALKKRYPKAQVVAFKHESSPPDLTYKRAIFVDIGPTPAQLCHALETADFVAILDHHQSAYNTYRQVLQHEEGTDQEQLWRAHWLMMTDQSNEAFQQYQELCGLPQLNGLDGLERSDGSKRSEGLDDQMKMIAQSLIDGRLVMHYNMDLAGCQLAWDLVNHKRVMKLSLKRPWFVDWIGQRDRFDYQCPYEEEKRRLTVLTAIDQTLPQYGGTDKEVQEQSVAYFQHLDQLGVSKDTKADQEVLYRDGMELMKEIWDRVDELVPSSEWYTAQIDGQTRDLLVVEILPDENRQIKNLLPRRLYRTYPCYGALVLTRDEGVLKVSLRAMPDQANLIPLAQALQPAVDGQRGGGGHPTACGATTDQKTWEQLVQPMGMARRAALSLTSLVSSS